MKTESNEIMDHIRKTILITSFLHDLETIANEMLKENMTLKNYLTMTGIYLKVNEYLSQDILVDSEIEKFNKIFTNIFSEWTKKNEVMK